MLTNKQKDELNEALYDYLRKENLESTLEAFRAECSTDFSEKQGGKAGDLLEKKWISIIRLQKKIIDLEAKVEELDTEIHTLSKFKRKDLRPEETELLMPKPPYKAVLNGHKGVVNKVAFHPFYTTVGSIGEDGAVKLWDFESGRLEVTLKGHTKSINSLAFDPTGNHLATASSDLSIKIWDLNENKCIKTLNGHDHTVSSVQFNSDGSRLISASRDATIKMWEVSSGYCLKTFYGHNEWVRFAVYNENDSMIASASNDQSIKLWSPEKDDPLQTLYGHEHVIECITFTKSAAKETVHLAKWNKETAAIQKAHKGKDLDDIISESKQKLAGFTPGEGGSDDGPAEVNPLDLVEYCISGSRDKTIKIWSCQSGAPLITLIGHDNWVRDLGFHHSGKFLVIFSI